MARVVYEEFFDDDDELDELYDDFELPEDYTGFEKIRHPKKFEEDGNGGKKRQSPKHQKRPNKD